LYRTVTSGTKKRCRYDIVPLFHSLSAVSTNTVQLHTYHSCFPQRELMDFHVLLRRFWTANSKTNSSYRILLKHATPIRQAARCLMGIHGSASSRVFCRMVQTVDCFCVAEAATASSSRAIGTAPIAGPAASSRMRARPNHARAPLPARAHAARRGARRVEPHGSTAAVRSRPAGPGAAGLGLGHLNRGLDPLDF
jgi:hypothetical protein